MIVHPTLHNVVGSGLKSPFSLRRISITSVLTRALYLSGRTVAMEDERKNCFVVRSTPRGRRQCLRQFTIGSKQTTMTQKRFSHSALQKTAGVKSCTVPHCVTARTSMSRRSRFTTRRQRKRTNETPHHHTEGKRKSLFPSPHSKNGADFRVFSFASYF